MTIAMAEKSLGCDWVECDDCEGWFDPNEHPVCTVTRYRVDHELCPNCAELAGCANCVSCGEAHDKDDLHDLDGNLTCIECANESGYELCCECGELDDNTDIVECNGNLMCEDCAEAKGYVKCYECGDYERHSREGPDCNDYCDSCFWDKFSECEDCGGIFYRDDLFYSNDSLYCESCMPEECDFDPAGFKNHSGCTTRIGSERCYGIELETDECSGYTSLDGSAAWGAKDDPTCDGKEFYTDILNGDDGLDAIVELTDMASSNSWHAGSSCGYHLHIDMRQENDDSLFSAAYAYRITEDLWFDCVESSRHNNGYCKRAKWSCDDVTGHDGSFDSFVRDVVRTRYYWINVEAYRRHTTFEVRLHHGSVNEDAVCNWVKAHTRFTDWATSLGLDAVREKFDGKGRDEQFEIIASEAWNDDALRSYYADRLGIADLVTCAE